MNKCHYLAQLYCIIKMLDEQKYIENQLVEAVKRRTEKSKTSGKC